MYVYNTDISMDIDPLRSSLGLECIFLIRTHFLNMDDVQEHG